MRPLAIVMIIDDPPSRGEIGAYDRIYEALGGTAARLSEWRRLHGFDSLGAGTDGQILASDYPVFSKVVDMFVVPSSSPWRKLSDLSWSAVGQNFGPLMKTHVGNWRRSETLG